MTHYRGFRQLFVFLTAVVWVSSLLLVGNMAVLALGGSPFVRQGTQLIVAFPMLLLLKRHFRPALSYLLDNYSRGWAKLCYPLRGQDASK